MVQVILSCILLGISSSFSFSWDAQMPMKQYECYKVLQTKANSISIYKNVKWCHLPYLEISGNKLKVKINSFPFLTNKIAREYTTQKITFPVFTKKNLHTLIFFTIDKEIYKRSL